jgi:hypothetical protein
MLKKPTRFSDKTEDVLELANWRRSSVGKAIGHCWRSQRLSRECLEARGACGGQRLQCEPSGQAIQVESGRRRYTLEGRFGQPTVAGSAQAEAAHALRDRRLDALPLPVEPPLIALQTRSRTRQGLMLSARMQAKPAAPRPGTAWFGGTHPADGRAEARADERNGRAPQALPSRGRLLRWERLWRRFGRDGKRPRRQRVGRLYERSASPPLPGALASCRA